MFFAHLCLLSSFGSGFGVVGSGSDEAVNADCGENKSKSLVDRASVGSEKPVHKSFSDWRRRVEWRRGSSLAKNFSGYRLTCNLTVA